MLQDSISPSHFEEKSVIYIYYWGPKLQVVLCISFAVPFFIPTFIHMQNYQWYSEINRTPFSTQTTWKEDYFYFRPPVCFNLFANKMQDQQGTVLDSLTVSKWKSWHPDLCFNRHNISLGPSNQYQGSCGSKSNQTALLLRSFCLEEHSFSQINENF